MRGVLYGGPLTRALCAQAGRGSKPLALREQGPLSHACERLPDGASMTRQGARVSGRVRGSWRRILYYG